MKEMRDTQDQIQALALCEKLIYREYLQEIGRCQLVEETVDQPYYIRWMKVTQFVYNLQENNLDKLTAVLNAINNMYTTLGYVIYSQGGKIEIYFGVRSSECAGLAIDVFKNSFKGNFPGVQVERVFKEDQEALIHTKLFNEENKMNLASVVVVPKNKNEQQPVDSQGMEKFIDTMLGEDYTAIFLAQSLRKEEMRELRRGMEEIYTLLSPFQETHFSFDETQSTSISQSLSQGIVESLSKTISKSKSKGHTEQLAQSRSTSKTHSFGFGAGVDFGVKLEGNYGFAKGKTEGTTKGKADTYTEGDVHAETNQKGSNHTDTHTEGHNQGTGSNYSFKMENKNILELLKRVDQLLERMQQSEDMGMFNYGAYFLAGSEHTSLRAASSYLGIVKGKGSGLENSYINQWSKQKDGEKYTAILSALSHLQHPAFEEQSLQGIVTPTTMVNCSELARGMSLPYQSVPGLPVMQLSPFARNISTYDEPLGDKINLGKLFHMGQEEAGEVALDVDSLAMHTFITGSTGSGKTNTTAKIVTEVIQRGVKVLVVEPVKGEYKRRFGGREDFAVYGINPTETPVLKLNPFAFPESIHVLEHIDRLIEIFSACWSLYAAMPAILKEAVERSYERVGWDLQSSMSVDRVFPTVQTLLEVLPEVINESAYAQELKSNYIGSLVTRVKSLANGLVGNIFRGTEISYDKLFEQNVIIDLNRVGSMETKSLIMGVIFLKLYEYRMSQNRWTHQLKHMTVLEEAHHLLRKESVAATEGSQIQSKSVEMITNAIAEMRAYGEGFVIVDQSPMLLDDAVIRNTNTKIILRLPDQSDRQRVGKAALLEEMQIKELARLRVGVAAVFQNNWLEPVLCKVACCKAEQVYKPQGISYVEQNKCKGRLLELLLTREPENLERLTDQESEQLIRYIQDNGRHQKWQDEMMGFIEQVRQKQPVKLLAEEQVCLKLKLIEELAAVGGLVEGLVQLRDADGMTTQLCNRFSQIWQLEKPIALELVRALLARRALEGESLDKQIYHEWVEYERGGLR